MAIKFIKSAAERAKSTAFWDTATRESWGYLLAAGANPLTANLLNFITLSLLLGKERQWVSHTHSFTRGFFPFGGRRRDACAFFCRAAERLEFIAAVSTCGRKNCVNFN
jgi:hypothetical protein